MGIEDPWDALDLDLGIAVSARLRENREAKEQEKDLQKSGRLDGKKGDFSSFVPKSTSGRGKAGLDGLRNMVKALRGG